MVDSTFGFARPEDSPGFLLWQTTITWQRLINNLLISYDISHAQFVLLAILLWLTEHQYETSQVNLIRLSKLDKMTVSKSLKALANKNLIKRSEHQIDCRAKSATLTVKGKNLINKLVPLVEKIDATFFNKINLSSQQTLLAILNKLLAE